MSETSSGTVRNSGIGSRHRWRFGLFEADLETCELRKGGVKVRVPHQAFQILAMLLDRAGEVITREELRRELWPSDVFVNFERSLNSAVQKLRSALQDPAHAARYIETLPKIGYRFVATVELVRPDSNSAAATATENSFGVPSATAVSEKLPSVPVLPGRSWKYWILATCLFVSLLLAAYAWHRYHLPRPPQAQANPSSVLVPSQRRRSIAVIGFRNVSGNPQSSWLSTAFAEMLATEMAAGDQLRMVAEEHVSRAKLELSLRNRDSYASDTLTKIRANLGCDYVVVGSYLALGGTDKGRVRFDARIQDAATGETIASVAVSGTQSDLFDLATHAGQQLRAKLDVEALTAPESEEVRVSLPTTPEAARLYSEGLAKLRLYDNLAARDLLEKTIQLEPKYSPAYSALATALQALGYDAKALAAARQANQLAVNLPKRPRLEAEARYHEMNGEWTQAADIYGRLQRSFPDDLDDGLRLARAQRSSGHDIEAAATLAGLRKLPAPQRDDPRIDLVEAETAGELSDYKKEQALAESAAKKSEAAGARLLMARANLVEGWAFDDQGDFHGAIAAYAAAQRIYAEVGDPDQFALASMNMGIVFLKQGDPTKAKREIEHARDVFRKQGDQARLAAALSNLGGLYVEQGSMAEAEHLFREAQRIWSDIGNKSREEGITNNLAAVLQAQGKFREAKDMLEPLVERLRGSGNRTILGEALESLGSIAETQGNMAKALQEFREAVSLFKDAGEQTDCGGAERLLGQAYLKEGEFLNANQALSEALSIDRAITARAEVALDQVVLAEIAFEKGDPPDPDTVRAALDELNREKMTDGEIEAQNLLTRELIRQGRTSEAAAVGGSAAALSKKSFDPTIRFDAALNIARLRVAQRRFADANRTLRPALQSAIQSGCVSCQLEARLELGEIEIASGNRERGRSELRGIADEAQRRGLGLIARRASADSQ